MGGLVSSYFVPSCLGSNDYNTPEFITPSQCVKYCKIPTFRITRASISLNSCTKNVHVCLQAWGGNNWNGNNWVPNNNGGNNGGATATADAQAIANSNGGDASASAVAKALAQVRPLV